MVTSTNFQQQKYYPQNGSNRAEKRAILIITVISVILLIVWVVVLVIMHNSQTWIFEPYHRPPLPEQTGNPAKLPVTGQTLSVPAGTNVIHMGTPIPISQADLNARSAIASKEIDQWETYQSNPVTPESPVNPSSQSISTAHNDLVTLLRTTRN